MSSRHHTGQVTLASLKRRCLRFGVHHHHHLIASSYIGLCHTTGQNPHSWLPALLITLVADGTGEAMKVATTPSAVLVRSIPKGRGGPVPYKYPQSSFHQIKRTITMMLSAILGGLSRTATLAWSHLSSLLQRQSIDSVTYSKNVTNCPGTFPPWSMELMPMYDRLHTRISDRV